jgi:AraC-like DNA-binding protein
VVLLNADARSFAPKVAPTPASGPTVSRHYAEALERFLLAQGWTDGPRVSLRGWRVEGAAFGEALTRGARELGHPCLGVAFGSEVGGSGYGLMGLAVSTAGTVREVIQQLQRYEPLTSTLGRLNVVPRGGLVQMQWRPTHRVPPAAAEAILAGWVSFGRYLLGTRVDVAEVSFAHACEGQIEDYEQTLQCPVRFDADEYAVSFRAELLDAPSRFADRVLNASLKQWLDHCSTAADTVRQTSTAARVVGLLSEQQVLPVADESWVSAMLQTGRRSLQRRLEAEGASFRRLLDAVRAQHTITALLHGDSGLLDLGAEVGFEEQSSLCRAVRRWTGYAPLKLRRRLSPVLAVSPRSWASASAAA